MGAKLVAMLAEIAVVDPRTPLQSELRRRDERLAVVCNNAHRKHGR